MSEEEPVLYVDILSQRLFQIFKQTWDRIPNHDQALLTQLVTIKQVDYIPEVESRIGQKTMGCAVSLNEPNEAGIYIQEIGLHSELNDSDKFADEVVAFVIAHELAHAILRHSRFARIMYEVESTVEKPQYSILQKFHEYHADFQVHEWGFDKELKFVYDSHIANKPPWFSNATART